MYYLVRKHDLGVVFWRKGDKKWLLNSDSATAYKTSGIANSVMHRMANHPRNRLLGHTFATISDSYLENIRDQTPDIWNQRLAFLLFA